MPVIKCDLVIRYDETRGSIVIQQVPAAVNDHCFQQPHASFAQMTSDFLALTPEAAEQRLGRVVFAQLDSISEIKIGIRDYVALAKEEFLQLIAGLELRADSNDAEATFELFRIC